MSFFRNAELLSAAEISAFQVLWKQTLTYDGKKEKAHVVEGLSPSCTDVEPITITDVP